MTTPDTTTPVMSLDDAVEAVRVAAALGMTIPVPEGLSVFEVTLFYEDGEEQSLGLFSSNDAAQTAARNTIIKDWNYAWFNPEDKTFYSDEEMEQKEWEEIVERWLATHTSEDVIHVWRNAYGSNVEVYISPRTVESSPTPAMK